MNEENEQNYYDEQNENTYYPDNSYNENRVQQNVNAGQMIPKNNRRNPGENFAKGFKNKVENGLNNNNNNLARGFNKPKKSNIDKPENKGVKNENPAKGQKDEPKRKNPLPGGTNKKDKKNLPDKPNEKNNKEEKKDTGQNKSFAKPQKFKEKLGLGKKKDTNPVKDVVSNSAKQAAKQGVKAIWLAIPIPAKIVIIVVTAVLPIVLFLAIILFIILTGGITGALASSMCSETSYDMGDDGNISSFMCSMENPIDGNYKVTDLFGWRNHNTTRIHEGIDLAGPKGTPIVAVHEGEVIGTLTGQGEGTTGYGNYVLIKHSNKVYTRYAHLSKVSVSKGERVERGQKIGERGTTGGSTGPHLHFEIRTGSESGTPISPNPYFGYSDKGYESCLDPSAGHQKRCDEDVSGSSRKMGTNGFKQACGITGNYTGDVGRDECCEMDESSSGTSGGSLIEFIKAFEGSGGYCDPDTKTQYKAYQNKGDKVTIGYGVTTTYIPDLKVGQCMSVSEVDKKKLEAVNDKRGDIQEIFKDANLTPYQEDAMVSMAYNGCSSFFKNIAKAAKEEDYAGVWKAMKGCTNGGMLGLERRRKAEFDLYVTGNYNIAQEYKSKSWTNAEYNDYDSENIIARKATGTSSECTTGSGGDKSKVVEIAIRELKANQGLSSAEKCKNIEKYLKACGYNGGRGGTHHYCAGFVSYVLKEAGVDKYVKLNPETPNKCSVPNYKKPALGTYHKAGGSYVPEPGDLVISNDWHHIMIVEKVEGKTLHIIGGNQSPANNNCPNNGAGKPLGNVTRNTYSLDSSTLVGYITYNVPTSNSLSSANAEKMKKYNKYKVLKTFKLKDLKKRATISSGYGAGIAQSFTIAENHYIVAQVNRASTVTAIQAYKTSNGKKVSNVRGNFGHANGMTYNKNTGKVIVINRGGHKDYWKFSASNAINNKRLKATSHKLSHNLGSIAYDPSTNKYYTGSGNFVRLFDDNFTKIRKFSKIRAARTKQDVGAYSGIVFVVDGKTSPPKDNKVDMYRVSDGAYLGSYNFDMSSYELESVAWDYERNELALLFYVSPGTNYIYATNKIKIG